MSTKPEGGRAALLLLLAVIATTLQARPVAQANNSSQHRPRLFRPTDLGLLEEPDRAAWQKPEQIMDALAIADGSTVADIGTGAGWFSVRLAQRVGPKGLVYAEDVQREMLDATRRRVAREGLRNVQLRRGVGSDPKLPDNAVDAVLVVDVYPEVDDRVTLLKNLKAAIKPNGRIGIVNYKPGQGGPGPAPNEGTRVDATSVEADARAAGLRVIARENLPFQYLIVLGR